VALHAVLGERRRPVHAGSCDRCGTVVKDDVLVREGTGGSARATLLE